MDSFSELPAGASKSGGMQTGELINKLQMQTAIASAQELMQVIILSDNMGF